MYKKELSENYQPVIIFEMIILNQLSLRHLPLDNILLTIQLNCGIEFNCELSDFSGTFAIARTYVKLIFHRGFLDVLRGQGNLKTQKIE